MDKKKIIRIIGNTLFYGILLIFIIISATMLKAKANDKQPSIFGNKFFIVLTGSMSPTIDVGDLVLVKGINPEDINVADIITFGSTSSDNITTHRVKEVLDKEDGISYITQGDANNVQDPIPVESDVLIGKVSKVIPRVGTILLFIQKNIIKILVTFILITTSSFLFSKFKSKAKNGRNEDSKEILG